MSHESCVSYVQGDHICNFSISRYSVWEFVWRHDYVTKLHIRNFFPDAIENLEILFLETEKLQITLTR